MQAAEGFRFLDVDMPNQFVLECLDTHGEWIDWGLYRAAEFERQEDGRLCRPMLSRRRGATTPGRLSASLAA